ncbi:MAG: 3-isopropylmalate dehydratase small subunit [Elusimicrobia bacterium]|nr:3-isopropylmalate dehydratase small subunit [Elusimicrobiota bacterium]
MIEGKVHRFGDNVSTDLICPGRFYHLRGNLQELAKHTLEDADASFAKKVEKGDIIVAGRNFGCGSSREHAARIIKMSGISCVIASSFARIFFRNCINIGLPAVEVPTKNFADADIAEVNLKDGFVENKTKNFRLSFPKFPEKIVKILETGGLVEYIKENKSL